MVGSIQHYLYKISMGLFLPGNYRRIPSILLAIILMLLSISAFARISEAWVALYDSGNYAHDVAVDVAYDSSGNVYVTGVVDHFGTSQDFLTIKYNASGSKLWSKRYNGPNNVKDMPYAIAVDASGNVYVTGETKISETYPCYDSDYITIKYDTNGNQLWVRQHSSYDCTIDAAYDMEVDSAGNVYVTGSGGNDTLSGGTIKYDTNGTELWSVYLRGYALALDAGRNVYVAGTGFVSKLDTDGNYIWGSSIDYGYVTNSIALALDAADNVYVRANTYVYKFDSVGNQLWQFACSGNPQCSTNALPWYWQVIYGKNSFTVDASGNAYMTGSTGDIETVKLDTNGNLLWVKYYNGPTNYNDWGNAITVDNAGGVYVAGVIQNQNTEWDEDFVTIKYDSNGNQKWVKEYSGKEYYADEFPLAIEVDGKGNIYIAGASDDAVFSSPDPPWGSGMDYVTIKYTQSDLVMTALSTTTAIAPGNTLSLSNTVKNQGGESAGSFTIAFHLSTDAVYGGTNDIAFTTTRSVSSLGGGASSSASTSVTVPSTTPLGNYYICAKADSGGSVSESNETNNTRCTTSTINVTRADLIMTAVTPGASSVNAGGTLSVTNTAKNQGGISAGSFTIAFRLSKNTTYGDSDDVTISTTRSVSSLGVGASNTATNSLTIPSTTKAESYYVCAKADSGSTITESIENNNTLCSSTQVTVPKPDLIMTALSTTTTAIKPGSSLSLSNTVKNQGGSSAGSSVIAFHLSSDAVYGGTDDIAFSTTRSVSSLGVGASSNASTSVTVPSTTPLGTYYICSKGDSGGTVSEGNETNNTRCTTSTINVTKPDLVMTAVTPGATTVNAGAALSVTNTAKNQGGISAGSFTIAFRLSKNTTYGDSDDVTISATRSVSSLGAGASNTATTSLTIPSTTKAGNYYVCAKADSGSTVAESIENNNTRCSTSQVTVPSPDLIMSALSTAATTVSRGGSFSLSNTAKNQGGSSAGSFAIAFHLSADAVYGGTDDRAFSSTRSVSSLGVGATSSASTSLTVSSTTPVGSYYICAKADSANTVNEGTNEGNNTRCTAATINVQ